MQPDIEILIASPNDAHDIAMLNTLFNGASDSAEAIASRVADPQRVETVVLAKKGGITVGFALVRIVPCVLYATPHAELTELFVLEEYRQQGIGRRLVTFVETFAVQKGAESLLVLTGDDNLPALSFYHANGFEEDDISLRKRVR